MTSSLGPLVGSSLWRSRKPGPVAFRPRALASLAFLELLQKRSTEKLNCQSVMFALGHYPPNTVCRAEGTPYCCAVSSFSVRLAVGKEPVPSQRISSPVLLEFIKRRENTGGEIRTAGSWQVPLGRGTHLRCLLGDCCTYFGYPQWTAN